jgi:glycosyltransferase involved in cell wall biosynthesis
VAPDDVVVGIVGRLTEVKNHELFLNAIRLLKDSHEASSHVRFVVVGDGALRRPLQQKVESLGLEANVTFAGNRRDPENFYPALDIVALTSLNEGTPLTLIEAMANARPVIATGVGGVVDLLGEPATEVVPEAYFVCPRGLRVRSGDASAFAAGLARLVRDEQLRREFGERGLQFVEQRYSRERLLKDVSGLYNELMQLAPGSSRVASGKTHAESRI